VSVLGTGIDLVDVEAFREQLADHASGFVAGVFSTRERSDAGRHGDPVPGLAARFAAKEAFVKAWSGSRFGLPPVMERADLRDIEVILDADHRPRLVLSGAVGDAVSSEIAIHVSLTHDGPMAGAVVVLDGG